MSYYSFYCPAEGRRLSRPVSYCIATVNSIRKKCSKDKTQQQRSFSMDHSVDAISSRTSIRQICYLEWSLEMHWEVQQWEMTAFRWWENQSTKHRPTVDLLASDGCCTTISQQHTININHYRQSTLTIRIVTCVATQRSKTQHSSQNFMLMFYKTYPLQRYWTRTPAVARIADHTGCQWPSRSSKVADFQVIWKAICNFLLVINSNLGPISHRLATIHQWQTNRRRQPWQQLDWH